MPEIVNRVEIANRCGVSLPTIDAWVRKGCPYVSRGSKGREWKFDVSAVFVWKALYVAERPYREKASGASCSLDEALTTAVAEVVARSATAARLAAQAFGLPVRTAYLLAHLVQDHLGEDGESLLDRIGVLRHEDALGAAIGPLHWSLEPDWPALAEAAGETFNEDTWDRAAEALVEAANV